MRGKATASEIGKRCLALRKQGQSLDEITKTVGLPRTTVFSIIRTVQLTDSQMQLFRERTVAGTIRSNQRRRGIGRVHKINRLPRLNNQLILCFSHFLFDGSITEQYCAYYNRSENLVDQQQSLMTQLFHLSGHRSYIETSGVHRLRYSSVELGHFFTQMKPRILTLLPVAPRRWRVTFLQAFFDDEGSIFISRNYQTRRVRGYQKDHSLLVLVQDLLQQLGINSTIDVRAIAVEIKGLANLRSFRDLIGFSPGLTLNPLRKNSIWKQPIEKRELLNRAIASYR